MIRVKPGVMLYLKYLYPYLALGIYPLAKWMPEIILEKLPLKPGCSEFIILAAVFIIPFVKYKRFSFIIDNRGFHFRRGLFIVRKTDIESPQCAVISIDRGPVSRILSSARLQVHTLAGVDNRAMIKTYISRKSADILQHKYFEEKSNAVKRFKLLEILIYALGSSSFIAGIFIAVPLLNRALTLSGKSLAEIFINAFGGNTSGFDAIINRLFKIPIILLAAGYAFDFLKKFIDMWSFKLTDSENCLSLRRGFVKLHTAFIPKSSICAVVCRQNPFFSLLKKKSVSILSNGYGRRIKDNDCILPLVLEHDRPCDTTSTKGMLKCAKNARLRPCKPYIVFALLSIAAASVGRFLLPQSQFAPITASALFLYCIAAIFVRLENYSKCFLILGDMVSVRAQHHLSVREMHLPQAHVAAVKFSQNPFDIKYKVCKVRVYAAHKRPVSIKIKNLLVYKAISSVYKIFVK